MMKTLLASTLLLATTGAMAHTSCDVDLDAGIRINQGQLEFLDGDKLIYKIVDQEKLIVNGEEISLSGSEQSLVNEYASEIHAVVPQVKSILIDGLDLASEGVDMAFTELLGQGNNVSRNLTDELANIRTELEARFASDDGFYIDHHGIESGDFFGQEFEERIESVVENAVMNSMGSILVAVGQEMMFSGGDSEAFETRMESFAERIEHEMEARGHELEEKAEQLCEKAVHIDELEEQLKQSIEEINDFNLITTRNSSNI